MKSIIAGVMGSWEFIVAGFDRQFWLKVPDS
jgi:hypothetical protein